MTDSDDWMVGGTDSIEVAKAAAKERARQDAESDGWVGPEAEEQTAYIDTLNARPGWYRWTPCNENSCYDGGGHSGHLGYAEVPGRGVFRGVYLTGGY